MIIMDQLKEQRDKIQAELEAENAQKALIQEKIEKTLVARVEANPELLKMYQENAKLGSENLGGALPQLKIHTQGKSENNILLSGVEPHDGWFIHTTTQTEYQTPNIHVLTISAGFRSPSMPDPVTGKTREVFNQLMGGVIITETEDIPFVAYFSGVKLNNLWEFGKSASVFTKGRFKMPLFTLTVKATAERVKHSYGKSWVMKFEIVKDEMGDPVLIEDIETFKRLKDQVIKMENTINQLIEAKTTEETELVSLNEVSEKIDDDIPF